MAKRSSVSPAASLPARVPALAKRLETDLAVDIGEEPVIENPDGSADVRLDQPAKEPNPDFIINLAEECEEVELDNLASDLLKKIEVDKKARERRDEQYEEGIRRTGLGQDAPGGASFQGASRVVHPMIAEACVDFASATMKELFPPNGPVRTKIEGDATQKKISIARRQERYLNWQLTEQVSEYAEELEQMLTQLPLGGSQYMKFWRDGTLKRVACEFVPIDDVYLPYACSDFYSAQRITHVQRLTQMVYEERVEDGFYREVSMEAPGQAPDVTKAEAATGKVEGKVDPDENLDGERIVYEVNTFAKLSCDKEERLPYLISIDERSRKIVAIYRNWEEEDTAKTRLHWMVEFGFIAWRGAYKIGLPHLIGGLSAAATGALRALLDSAHFNNLPGFLRLKGARMGGQTKEINPAQGVEVEASAAIDDIKKIVMAMPYNPPSPVLFELIGWLSEAGKGVVTTAEEKIKDASNQMPVGTALALIEQGAKVFSSIHARLHRSQRKALQIISRLNRKHLSIGEQMTKLGEVLAAREDFGQPLAVIPVSDPNIFSETQRYAQMQMVLQLAQGVDPKTGEPTATGKLHDLYQVVRRMYELAKIPDYEEFLPEPKKPTELNAAAENAASMMGEPIIAFPYQDHYAHIECHMRFVVDPFLGGGIAAEQSMPTIIEHVKQHLSFLYAKMVYDEASKALNADLGETMKDPRNSPKIDRLIAGACSIVHPKLIQQLQPLGPAINEILQKVAQMKPPMPMDPSQAVLEVEKMKQAGADKDRATKEKLEGAKISTTSQEKQGKLALDGQGQQIDATLSAAELAHTREKDHRELDLKERELDQNAVLEVAGMQQADRQHEMGMRADMAKDEANREFNERQGEADRAFQEATGAADRAHESQKQILDHDAAYHAKLMDQSHDARKQSADHAFQDRQGDKDRKFQATQDVAGRTADFIENDAAREHERVMSKEERKAAERSQDKELGARKDELKSTERREDKKLKADERKTKMTLAAKKQEAKSKPKSKKGRK